MIPGCLLPKFVFSEIRGKKYTVYVPNIRAPGPVVQRSITMILS